LDILAEFTNKYNLTQFAHNGWVYFEITKGVCGLKQAGKLANDLLTERLHTFGYFQLDITPGLWHHKWCPISFVLIVDDFEIKFIGQHHVDHLLHVLQKHFTVTTDWTGTKFTGIDLTRDYTEDTCCLSMQNYINNLLLKYNHPKPHKPQH
jgi:hypothetical protein